MHMASIGIFEGPPLYGVDGRLRIDDIRGLIASRLELVPKLRQCASKGLLGEAPPAWVDHPDFDIAEHVRVQRVRPPGTEVELRQLCAALMAIPLERTRPLWELIFVEGLTGGRVALVEKLHHSMADGLAASELATVLLDLSPDPPQPEKGAPPWAPAIRPPAWRSAVDDLIRLGTLPVRVAKWYGRSVLHPVRTTSQLGDLGRAFGTLLTPRIFAPRSSLNAEITEARSVEFVRLPFEQVRRVADTFDVTINDVLLTVVAGGLHDLLSGRGELSRRSELQALVPVGLATTEGRGLANDVSALFVRLPIGGDDPVALLKDVAAEVGEDKRRHQALAAITVLRLLEPLPQDILAGAAEIIQHQPFFNLVVTNVPGPPVPLYALGSKLLEAFPIVPLAGNQSLAVAALSYEGRLNLGVLSDPVTCPDVEVFCEGVLANFRSLVARTEGGPRSNRPGPWGMTASHDQGHDE
jgi:WS/DGAT/MGAT family acyltransferase